MPKLWKFIFRFLAILYLLYFLVALISCSQEPCCKPEDIEKKLVHDSPSEAQSNVLKPVSFTLICDFSQSTENEYSQPPLEQINYLLDEYFIPRGGMFAVGEVEENGEKPFLEIFIEPFPQKPIEPIREGVNSFDYYEVMKVYKDQLATYHYLKDKREREIQLRLQGFKKQLAFFWQQERNAKLSDIMGSLTQANRHHAINAQMDKLTVLISDGIDDVFKPMPSISGDLMMVYASQKANPQLLQKASCYPSFNSLIQSLVRS
ncbi:MAG: hypothetical protein ACPGJS_16810 [Flammeovirgaceae bacterium]